MGDEQAEERERPDLLEVNYPGELPRPWPAAEVVHQVVGDAPMAVAHADAAAGRGVETVAVDIFSSLVFIVGT
jgi:hypothetical protein